jgi:cold shock protein
MIGRVVFFKHSYGFLHEIDESGKDMDGEDIFVHFSGIIAEGYKNLKTGSKVTFELGKNLRGEVIAVEVKEIKE